MHPRALWLIPTHQCLSLAVLSRIYRPTKGLCTDATWVWKHQMQRAIVRNHKLSPADLLVCARS